MPRTVSIRPICRRPYGKIPRAPTAPPTPSRRNRPPRRVIGGGARDDSPASPRHRREPLRVPFDHRRAGREPCTLEHRTPYALRHTFATFSIAAGVGLFDLSRLMGTSLQQIDKTYGHLLPDSLDRARAALDVFISDGQSTAERGALQ